MAAFTVSIRVSRRDEESIHELGRDDGHEANGIRARSADIEPQMRLLLSNDEISLNKLTKPFRVLQEPNITGKRRRYVPRAFSGVALRKGWH
jgi:hypothetical protein